LAIPVTFGKGTVQNMIEIGRVMPFLGGGNGRGALKLTIREILSNRRRLNPAQRFGPRCETALTDRSS
jgi:Na+/citrate or Na+/malate symporter